MEEYVLAIDDTAFAANEKRFLTLKSEECCFCSVAVKKDLLPLLDLYMQDKCDELMKRFGTREFHFTDMYNRRGDFKDIKLEETLEIIKTFAADMNDAEMLITVSTINKHSYKDPSQVMLMNMIKDSILPNIGLPKDNTSMNLVLSVIRSNGSLNKFYGNNAKITEAVCDEGIKKSGKSFALPMTSGNVEVKFDKSTNYLLQFADFAAWFVTRAKHILDKPPEKQKAWEKELLYIYSTLPFANLEHTKYKIGSTKPFDYDKTIDELSDKQKGTF